MFTVYVKNWLYFLMVMTCVMQHWSRLECKTGKSKETSSAPQHAVCGCIEYQCPAVLSLCVCLAAVRWHLRCFHVSLSVLVVLCECVLCANMLFFD